MKSIKYFSRVTSYLLGIIVFSSFIVWEEKAAADGSSELVIMMTRNTAHCLIVIFICIPPSRGIE